MIYGISSYKESGGGSPKEYAAFMKKYYTDYKERVKRYLKMEQDWKLEYKNYDAKEQYILDFWTEVYSEIIKM